MGRRRRSREELFCPLPLRLSIESFRPRQSIFSKFRKRIDHISGFSLCLAWLPQEDSFPGVRRGLASLKVEKQRSAKEREGEASMQRVSIAPSEQANAKAKAKSNSSGRDRPDPMRSAQVGKGESKSRGIDSRLRESGFERNEN